MCDLPTYPRGSAMGHLSAGRNLFKSVPPTRPRNVCEGRIGLTSTAAISCRLPCAFSKQQLGWLPCHFVCDTCATVPHHWDDSLQPACRVYVATTGGLLVTGGRQTNAPATTFYRNSRILFTTLSYEVGYIRRMVSMCSSSTFMSALYGTPLQASRNSEP